VEPV
jgi:hypothetical protein